MNNNDFVDPGYHLGGLGTNDNGEEMSSFQKWLWEDEETTAATASNGTSAELSAEEMAAWADWLMEGQEGETVGNWGSEELSMEDLQTELVEWFMDEAEKAENYSDLAALTAEVKIPATQELPENLIARGKAVDESINQRDKRLGYFGDILSKPVDEEFVDQFVGGVVAQLTVGPDPESKLMGTSYGNLAELLVRVGSHVIPFERIKDGLPSEDTRAKADELSRSESSDWIEKWMKVPDVVGDTNEPKPHKLVVDHPQGFRCVFRKKKNAHDRTIEAIPGVGDVTMVARCSDVYVDYGGPDGQIRIKDRVARDKRQPRELWKRSYTDFGERVNKDTAEDAYLRIGIQLLRRHIGSPAGEQSKVLRQHLDDSVEGFRNKLGLQRKKLAYANPCAKYDARAHPVFVVKGVKVVSEFDIAKQLQDKDCQQRELEPRTIPLKHQKAASRPYESAWNWRHECQDRRIPGMDEYAGPCHPVYNEQCPGMYESIFRDIFADIASKNQKILDVYDGIIGTNIARMAFRIVFSRGFHFATMWEYLGGSDGKGGIYLKIRLDQNNNVCGLQRCEAGDGMMIKVAFIESSTDKHVRENLMCDTNIGNARWTADDEIRAAWCEFGMVAWYTMGRVNYRVHPELIMSFFLGLPGVRNEQLLQCTPCKFDISWDDSMQESSVYDPLPGTKGRAVGGAGQMDQCRFQQEVLFIRERLEGLFMTLINFVNCWASEPLQQVCALRRLSRGDHSKELAIGHLILQGKYKRAEEELEKKLVHDWAGGCLAEYAILRLAQFFGGTLDSIPDECLPANRRISSGRLETMKFGRTPKCLDVVPAANGGDPKVIAAVYEGRVRYSALSPVEEERVRYGDSDFLYESVRKVELTCLEYKKLKAQETQDVFPYDCTFPSSVSIAHKNLGSSCMGSGGCCHPFLIDRPDITTTVTNYTPLASRPYRTLMDSQVTAAAELVYCAKHIAELLQPIEKVEKLDEVSRCLVLSGWGRAPTTKGRCDGALAPATNRSKDEDMFCRCVDVSRLPTHLKTRHQAPLTTGRTLVEEARFLELEQKLSYMAQGSSSFSGTQAISVALSRSSALKNKQIEIQHRLETVRRSITADADFAELSFWDVIELLPEQVGPFCGAGCILRQGRDRFHSREGQLFDRECGKYRQTTKNDVRRFAVEEKAALEKAEQAISSSCARPLCQRLPLMRTRGAGSFFGDGLNGNASIEETLRNEGVIGDGNRSSSRSRSRSRSRNRTRR